MVRNYLEENYRENSEVNLTLISEMVGFSDSHYFSRIFRSIVGITPSEYKKQVQPRFDSVESTASSFLKFTLLMAYHQKCPSARA